MLVLFTVGVGVIYAAEAHGTPAMHAALLHGANIQDTETRFGAAGSAMDASRASYKACYSRLPRTGLLAGRAVHRPARMPSAAMSLTNPTAVCGANRWRRPPDQETQRRVVGALLGPLRQRARVNGAEHG